MGSFPKFRLKKSKLSILTENWHTWYLGGADSKSRLWFLKVRPQNPFFGEFGPKKSKLYFLPENWHIWYLEDGDSYSNISCEFPTLNPVLGKFGPKESKLSVLPANWHTWYLGDADSYSNISFLNLQPKIYFWANLDQKSQSCLFRLKIGTHGIFRMLILVPTLVLWISKSKSIFGKNLGQKSQSYPFLAKIGTQYLEGADSYSDISFLNFQPRFHFWADLDWKVEVFHFAWKLAYRLSWGCWFLLRVFWIPQP